MNNYQTLLPLETGTFEDPLGRTCSVNYVLVVSNNYGPLSVRLVALDPSRPTDTWYGSTLAHFEIDFARSQPGVIA